jgi:hypothetical protein
MSEDKLLIKANHLNKVFCFFNLNKVILINT